MKKILVTGSSGYIGQTLCNVLTKSGHKVYGFDRVLKPQNVDGFFHGDITEMPKLSDDFDVVVHLAALVRVNESMQKPMQYYQTNITGTLNVLEKLSYKNFIFASTGAAENPGLSNYALTKWQSEMHVRKYCSHIGVQHSIFRFYNVTGVGVIGPTNPDGLLYNLIKAKTTGEFNLYGHDYKTTDGTALRDYIHVLDVCAAIERAINRPSNIPGAEITPLVENLGTGYGHTVQEMVDIFKKVNSCDFKVNYLPKRQGDLEKSVLSDPSPYFRNSFTIEEMLKVKE